MSDGPFCCGFCSPPGSLAYQNFPCCPDRNQTLVKWKHCLCHWSALIHWVDLRGRGLFMWHDAPGGFLTRVFLVLPTGFHKSCFQSFCVFASWSLSVSFWFLRKEISPWRNIPELGEEGIEISTAPYCWPQNIFTCYAVPKIYSVIVVPKPNVKR